jgi:hypothetical protein
VSDVFLYQNTIAVGMAEQLIFEIEYLGQQGVEVRGEVAILVFDCLLHRR